MKGMQIHKRLFGRAAMNWNRVLLRNHSQHV
jgi:hypothetical protein